MTDTKTYSDITAAYSDVRKVRKAGGGASLTCTVTLITVTFKASKKVLRKI
jgi:hypothetical protein